MGCGGCWTHPAQRLANSTNGNGNLVRGLVPVTVCRFERDDVLYRFRVARTRRAAQLYFNVHAGSKKTIPVGRPAKLLTGERTIFRVGSLPLEYDDRIGAEKVIVLRLEDFGCGMPCTRLDVNLNRILSGEAKGICCCQANRMCSLR